MSIDARRSGGSLRAARRPRVELPPTNSERLHAPKLIAIGAASLAAGLVLVLLLSSRSRAPAGAEPSTDASLEHASHAHAHAPQPAEVDAPPVAADAGQQRTRAAIAEATPKPTAPIEEPAAPIEEPAARIEEPAAPRDEHARVEAARRAEAPIAPPAPEPTVPAVATPVASPADPTGAALQPAPVDAPNEGEGKRVHIELGQVAYLRCDGLAAKRGAFPCPRDRALEKSVREILTNVERCRVAAELGRGRYEVRLELSASGARSELHVRAPSDAAERAVRACAGAALAKVTTALRPDRMIVAQRFSVR